MKTIKIKTCHAFKVGGDAPDHAFCVEAVLENGAIAYHKGSPSASFFTEDQACSLANKTLLAGNLVAADWQSARGNSL